MDATDNAIRQSLRTVLRQGWPMTHIHDAAVLTRAGFMTLFSQDMTFGGYGMPIAQHDPFLNIVALTAFQPYDKTEDSSVDVITLLTPIYRILCTLAVITACDAGFDDFARVSDSTLGYCLPYRPRVGKSVTQYGTLLEVAKSVWKSICHAYTSPEDRNRVRELHTLYPDQSPAPAVWIDVDVSAVIPMVATRDIKRWFTLRAKTYAEDLSVILLDRQEEGQEDLDVQDCALTIYSGKKSLHAPLAPSESRLIGRRYLDEEGALIFERIPDPPYVCLTQGDVSRSYFLLIACERGSYSAFYRNDGPDGVRSYPLYFHPLTSDEDAQLTHDEEMSGTAGRLGLSTPKISSSRCCVCSKVVDRPMYDDLEDTPAPGKARLVYCSQKCIRNMSNILLAKEREEERLRVTESAARKHFSVDGISARFNEM